MPVRGYPLGGCLLKDRLLHGRCKAVFVQCIGLCKVGVPPAQDKCQGVEKTLYRLRTEWIVIRSAPTLPLSLQGKLPLFMQCPPTGDTIVCPWLMCDWKVTVRTGTRGVGFCAPPPPAKTRVFVFASRQSESGACQTSGIDRLSLAASQYPATLRALIPAQAPASVPGKSLMPP